MRFEQEDQSKQNYQKVHDTHRMDFEIKPFDAERKDIGNNNCIRESLSVTWKGPLDKKILAIGINPSVAKTGKSDCTMTKLCRFLDMYGFNNVHMINLYEGVSPQQGNIPQGTETDFEQKRQLFKQADIILIVWGIGGNSKRKERKLEAMKVLADYNDRLYAIMNPKGKYPAHPSRMPYESTLIKIEIKEDSIIKS